jgi:transcriptional regulator with PAS, ATPase and Fis domain
VLIQGENGTGKELIARAIHFNSRRQDRAFVVQNCSALNDNLLDSELFGHKKGAFTGASTDKQGLFDLAHGGTFFLDEVGDMSPTLQVKMLRVLQEGTFLPVGGTVVRKVDVRIIAATNRDLKEMVAQGTFREDLFYRLNVINLVVPPLRQRRSDIPLLVEHFLQRTSRRMGIRPSGLEERAQTLLLNHDWPGNVRELENEVERLVVLAGDGQPVDASLLSPRIRGQQPRTAWEPDFQNPVPTSDLPGTLEALEKRMLLEGLRHTGWNKTHAARQLGISRRNLIRKVERYQLEKLRDH